MQRGCRVVMMAILMWLIIMNEASLTWQQRLATAGGPPTALPVASDAGVSAREAGPPASIFFVDDDSSLRHSAAMLLEVSGFIALTFDSAESLLSSCDAACDPRMHGCFVLDLNLPGLDGAQLLCELRQRGSTLPAILITHRSSDARARAAQLRAAGFGLILEKPFGRGELVRAVRTALRLPLEN